MRLALPALTLAVLLSAPAPVFAASLMCDDYPPTCWICLHPVQDGTGYQWWDQPGGVFEISPHGVGYFADVHCSSNHGLSGTVHANKFAPLPAVLATKQLNCPAYT